MMLMYTEHISYCNRKERGTLIDRCHIRKKDWESGKGSLQYYNPMVRQLNNNKQANAQHMDWSYFIFCGKIIGNNTEKDEETSWEHVQE